MLEIVDNDQAFGVLNTQLAAGDAPDIVGPVGIRGRDDFADLAATFSRASEPA